MMHFSKFIARILGLLLLVEGSVAMAVSYTPAPGASLSGGIGDEELETMRAARGSYNLRLTFATVGSGEYVAGISVKVERIDRIGLSRLYPDSGPLLYLDLEPGTYRISATYGDLARVRTVRVGKGAVEQVFYWPEASSVPAAPAVGHRHHRRSRI